MDSDSFTVDVILSMFLVFVRVSAVFMTAPFFSHRAYPIQVRLYFALITSIILFYVIPDQGALISTSDGTVFLFTAIVKEALVGFALGLVGQLVFAGIEMAGSLISLNTGLSFANMLDAATQRQNPVLANILTMVAIIVFLAIDGEKIYITALAKSYQIVPANDHNVHLAGLYLLDVAKYLFVLGVQLTSPFMISIFLMDVSLAIFARIMPQANLMFIALPVKMGVGVAMLMLILPYLPTVFDIMFQNMFQFMEDMLWNIRPVIGP